MDVTLVMFRSNGTPRPFKLKRAATVIGRRDDCDLRIPLGDVSRKHARLSIDAATESLSIEDLGSSNGTFVNGRRVQSVPIEAGDTLRIGPVQFVVQVNGDPEIDPMNPMLHLSPVDSMNPTDSMTDLMKLPESDSPGTFAPLTVEPEAMTRVS